jgi:hypothetical protein
LIPDLGTGIEPDVAASGSTWLAVWEEFDTGGIFGVRVSASGSTLDPRTHIANGRTPAVASNGAGWRVTTHLQNGSGVLSNTVSTSFVSSAASEVSAALITAPQAEPVIAYDGTNFLVVWEDERAGPLDTDIYATRVDGSGNVLDTSGIPVSYSGGLQVEPAVAVSGSTFLVVWRDFRNGNLTDIYGARLTATGAVLDQFGFPISTAADEQSDPAVASNGSGFVVAWRDFRNGANTDIYGSRVTTAGAVTDANGFVVSNAANVQAGPSLAAIGNDYLIAWEDSRTGTNWDVYAARYNTGSGLVTPAGVPVSARTTEEVSPAVAANGTNFLVTWTDQRNPSYDIYGARVSAAASVLEANGIAISTGADDQIASAVAANGLGFLVVWRDRRNGGGIADIYGTRVDDQGAVQDPAGLVVSQLAQDEGAPAVVRGPGADTFRIVYDRLINDPTVLTKRVFTRAVTPSSK